MSLFALQPPRLSLSRWTSLLPYRWLSSSAGTNSLEWEDLPPADPLSFPAAFAMDEDELLPTQRKGRFYVPAPYTDDQLKRVGSPESVAEWPKSRVVWALGRIGYISRHACGPDGGTAYEKSWNVLLNRLVQVVNTCNTRDLVRVLQAIAYSPCVADSESVGIIRRSIAKDIEKVNELFLVSLVYAHLKLVGRIDWTLTPNCARTTQFLLSEVIHRKSKIDAARMLELATTLISNDKSRRAHADTVEMILAHAVEHSLRHVKQAGVIEAFGKAVCCLGPSAQEHFTKFNDRLTYKFASGKPWKSAEDALRIGFWFVLAELTSVGVVNSWLKAVMDAKKPLGVSDEPTKANLEIVQMIRFVAHIVEARQYESIIDEPVLDWLTQLVDSVKRVDLLTVPPEVLLGGSSPVLGVENVHCWKVLKRIVDATVEPAFLGPVVEGPFHLALANRESKICVEWSDSWLIEAPHRRGVAKIITDLRRAHLQRIGYDLVLLNLKDFKPKTNGVFDEVNDLFRTTLGSRLPFEQRIEIMRGTVSEPIYEPNSPPPVEGSSQNRERRESKAREYRLKNQLKSIRKQFYKKSRRRPENRAQQSS